MTRMFVNAQVRAMKALERRSEDAGQGTLEYLGIVVVAAILVVALITVFNNDKYNVGKMVTKELDKIIAAIG